MIRNVETRLLAATVVIIMINPTTITNVFMDQVSVLLVVRHRIHAIIVVGRASCIVLHGPCNGVTAVVEVDVKLLDEPDVVVVVVDDVIVGVLMQLIGGQHGEGLDEGVG